MKEGYSKKDVGSIPNEWQVKTIGELFEFKNGLNKEKEFFGKGTKIINYVDVFKNRALDNNIIQGLVEVSEKEKQLFNTKKGDVFFTRTSETVDEIGMTSVLLENINDLVYSGFVLRARPKTEELDLFYKKYCFSEFYTRKQIMRKSSCTTRALTSGTLLKDVLMKIPTIKEQQKIAEILSTVDSQIDDTDKLIEKTKELKKGLMQRLLTKGIGHTQFKMTEIGEIPVDWDVRRLGDIVNIKSGNSPSKFNFCDGGKYPFFKVDDMNYSTKYLRIGKLYYNESNFDLMNRGMIIFPKRGASIFTNKILLLDSDGFFDTNLMGLICSEKVNNEFLYYFLSYYELSKIADTSSIPQINNKHVEPLIISLPEMKEQKEIASILSTVDTQIEEYESKKSKLEQLKKALMQQLLTGKIRING